MVELLPSNSESKARRIALEKASLLKLRTEQYYNNLVQQAVERAQRYIA